MRVVTQVPFGMGGCSVLPQRKADPDGFIHVTNPPPQTKHQFISCEAIKIMGHEFGMVPKEEAKRLRFENHRLERELQDANDTIAANERLEEELLEARQTLRESEKILAVFRELADEGYNAQKAKGLRKRITAFRDNLDEAEQTIAEYDDAMSKIAALSREGRREKVPA